MLLKPHLSFMQSSRKLKIVFLINYYGMYLNSFTRKHPQLKTLNYSDANALMMSDFFGAYCSYSMELSSLGHDSQVIVPNFEIFQKKWAQENRYTYDKSNWLKDIAIEQIKRLKPDVLFFGSNFELYDNDFLDQLKIYAKHLVAWTSCPIPQEVSHKKFDLVFTSLPYYVDLFRSRDINCELIHAAFDPQILKYITQRKQWNLSFIGGFSEAHHYRYEVVSHLVKEVNMQVFGYGLETSRFVKPIHFVPLIRKIKKPVFGIEMYQTLASSKITLNVHAELAKDNSVNMRLFEATGSGTLLLTDYSDSLSVFFEDNKEVITFRSKEEALDKANYYLKNESLATSIAQRGQQRTLNHYNYQVTTKKILEHFTTYFK